MLRRIFLKLWRRRRLQRDLEAELAFHRDLSRENANPIPLGNVGRIQEEALDLWRFAFIEDFWRDVMYAIRSLRHTPGFTAIAILTLSLGIGANTAIFTLMDRVMLESLPVRQPDQLIEFLSKRGGGLAGSFSYQALEYFRDHTQLCSSIIAATLGGDFHLLIENQPMERVSGQFVTGNYFSELGVSALRGRPILPEDDRRGAGNPVAMISYAMWQDRFGGDAGAIGRQLLLENIPLTIIGVAPATFRGIEVGKQIDVWVPLEVETRFHRPSWTSSGQFKWLRLVGRLTPGITVEKAYPELRLLFNTGVIENEIVTRSESPLFNEAEAEQIRKWALVLGPADAGLSATRREFSKPLAVLMTIVGVLLLIACANIANLLFARALAREKEIAMRLSLGAGRFRLIRQLVTESAVLAGAGGTLGLITAYLLSRDLAAFLATGNPPLRIDVSPNLTVLGFVTGITISSVILFGLMPAFRGTGIDLASRLKGTAAGLHGSKANRWSGGLIVVQVALLMVLILGAGLFLRTLHNLNSADLGFDRNNVLLVRFDAFGTGHSREQLKTLTAELLGRIEAVPGVKAASMDMFPPISGGSGINFDFVINSGSGGATIARGVYVNIVSPRYFATLDTPIIAGRDFASEDSTSTSRVIIVNQTFARRYFGSTAALGKTIIQRGNPMEIIGIAGDTKYEDVRQEMQPTVYYDVLQPGTLAPDAPVPTQFLIRTTLDPAVIAATIRAEVRSVIGNVTVTERTMNDHIDSMLVRERLVTTLAGFFGGLALLLAVIGLYGVVSNSVSRRTREIGIRIALGFNQRRAVSMVLREVFVLVGAGIVLGLPVAVFLTRSVSSLLYGLTPQDPRTILESVGALLISAFAAGFIPARRASHVDPMAALRND
jgi:predicted permease